MMCDDRRCRLGTTVYGLERKQWECALELKVLNLVAHLR